MKKERYRPVALNLARTLRRWSRDPEFRAAYAALEDEFVVLDELLGARLRAGLTQAEVAERMGIAQASVARLEASAGSRKHAPSVATLRRYADAVDCELKLSLVPKPARRSQAAAKPVARTPRKRA